MLQIRSEQAEALAEAARRSLIDRLATTLRRAHGRRLEHRADGPLHGFIDAGIAQADAHGITDVADVEEFLHVLIEHGPTMPDAPWARAILNRQDLLPFQRITLLSQHSAQIKAGGHHV